MSKSEIIEGKDWVLGVVKPGPNILYYQNDPVSKMKGVGKKTAEVLKQVGVKTVQLRLKDYC